MPPEEHDRAGFWWRNRELDDTNEKSGRFTLEDIQFFLQLVFKVNGCLMLETPHLSFDFVGNSHGEVCMEIHDQEGMHVAMVTPDQAQVVARRALQDWDARILRGRLCDLAIDWMVTSEEYA